MARPKGAKNRAKITSLPQIGRTTEQCRGAEDKLNEFGLLGYRLLGITLNGHANREANAVFDATDRKWEYKVIQFSMRDPKVAEKTVNELGEDGWIFHQVYSQGANMFATALVLIRPSTKLADAGPEQELSDASETSGNFDVTENASNVSAESFAAVA